MKRFIIKAFTGFLGTICAMTALAQTATVTFRNNPFFQRYPLELYRESVYRLTQDQAIHPTDSLSFTLEISDPEGEYFRLWQTNSLLIYLKPGSDLVVDYASRNSYLTKFDGDVAAENAWLNQKLFLSYDLLYPGRINKNCSYRKFKHRVKHTADSLRQEVCKISSSPEFIRTCGIRLDFTVYNTLLNYYESVAFQKKEHSSPNTFQKWEKDFKEKFLKTASKMLEEYREREILEYIQVTDFIGNTCYRMDSSFALRAGYALFDEQYRWSLLKNDVYRLYGTGAIQFLENAKDPVIRREVNRFLEDNRNLLTGSDAMDFEFQDIHGTSHRLSDFKGTPIYIDVWATWCNPCKALAPAFHKLAEEFQASDIHFISISIDKQRSAWINYLNKQNHAHPVLEVHSAEKGFTEKYRITGIPRFILIDKNFKIRMAFGYKPLEYTMTALKEVLEGMAQEELKTK